MGRIELSLSDDLRSYVDRAVETGDFADDAAFIESLIRDHHDRKLAALIEALEEGERSGVSPRSFDEIVAAARDLTGQQEDWMTDEIGAAIDEGEASGYSDRTLEQIFAEAKAKFLSR